MQPDDQVRLKVTSGSMRPVLQAGDWIWVTAADPTTIRRGDIVVMRVADHFLTHRVVALTADGCQTKGDNSLQPDPEMGYKDILGRVTHRKRNNRQQILDKHPHWSQFIGDSTAVTQAKQKR